jgi:hypothetical protein
VSRFIADFDLSEALCDGCAFGMKDGNGHPILKPWRIVTTSRLLAQNMSKCRCTHERGFRHAQLEGSLTPASAFYPPSMCTTALTSLFPWTAQTAPAMPTVPVASDPPYVGSDGHFAKDECFNRVAPSLEPVGLVFETDSAASGYKGSPVQLTNLDDFDLEIDAGEDAQVIAAVTRLLSRPEMMGNPKAKEAIRKEAEGLVEKRNLGPKNGHRAKRPH